MRAGVEIKQIWVRSHSYVGFLHFEALFGSSEHLIDHHLHKHYVRICASTKRTRTVWCSPALCFVSCSCQIRQMLPCLGCWCWCRSWTHPQTDLSSTWFGCLGYLELSAILGLIFLASFYRGSIHGIKLRGWHEMPTIHEVLKIRVLEELHQSYTSKSLHGQIKLHETEAGSTPCSPPGHQ